MKILNCYCGFDETGFSWNTNSFRIKDQIHFCLGVYSQMDLETHPKFQTFRDWVDKIGKQTIHGLNLSIDVLMEGTSLIQDKVLICHTGIQSITSDSQKNNMSQFFDFAIKKFHLDDNSFYKNYYQGKNLNHKIKSERIAENLRIFAEARKKDNIFLKFQIFQDQIEVNLNNKLINSRQEFFEKLYASYLYPIYNWERLVNLSSLSNFKKNGRQFITDKFIRKNPSLVNISPYKELEKYLPILQDIRIEDGNNYYITIAADLYCSLIRRGIFKPIVELGSNLWGDKQECSKIKEILEKCQGYKDVTFRNLRKKLCQIHDLQSIQYLESFVRVI